MGQKRLKRQYTNQTKNQSTRQKENIIARIIKSYWSKIGEKWNDELGKVKYQV